MQSTLRECIKSAQKLCHWQEELSSGALMSNLEKNVINGDGDKEKQAVEWLRQFLNDVEGKSKLSWHM